MENRTLKEIVIFLSKKLSDEESRHRDLPVERIEKQKVRNRVFKGKQWRAKKEAHPVRWAALEKLYLYPVLTLRVFLLVFSLSAVMSAVLGYTIQDTLMPDDKTEQKIVCVLFLTLVLFFFGLCIAINGKIAASLEYTVIKNSKASTVASILSLLAVLVLAIFSGIWFVYELFFCWVKQKSLLSFGTFILTLIASKVTPKALARHAYEFLPFSGVAVEQASVAGRKEELFKCPVCSSVIKKITVEPSGIAKLKEKDAE